MLPPMFKCNPAALQSAIHIALHQEAFFENYEKKKHVKTRGNSSTEQVFDDIFDDEWDPSMQHQQQEGDGAVDSL